MDIIPLAFESLGTRGMATFVFTGELGILIDPGVDLAPMRFKLPPHRIELERKDQQWKSIREYAEKSDILVITHYHHDHFHEDEWGLFRGMHVLLKHPTEYINFNQKRRAKMLLERIRDIAADIQYVDSKAFIFNNLKIQFSQPVCHGINDRSGYVVQVSIQGDTSFLHTSDVTGPALPDQVEFILRENPDTIICDGPVSYMVGSRYDPSYLDTCINNLISIIEKTKVQKLVLEHHLLRELDWAEKIAPVFDAARRKGIGLLTAAEFAGLETELLEAQRKELYQRFGPNPNKSRF